MAKGWLIGGGVFLAALLIVSVVVALADTEEPLPEGSPEAALQAYLRASENEDYRTAYEFLSSDLKGRCTFEQFVSGRYPGDTTFKDNRVVLEDTTTVNGTTFVDVRITQFDSGGGFFGSSEWTSSQRFTMKMEDGQWRFSEIPWPYYYCDVREPFPPATPTPAFTPTPTPTATPVPSA